MLDDRLPDDDVTRAHWVVAANNAVIAWQLASVGADLGAARLAYEVADGILLEGSMGPNSMLRHTTGEAVDCLVRPIPPTEDSVTTLHLQGAATGTPEEGLIPTRIDATDLQCNIVEFLATFNPGFHAGNIPRHLPHVMAMSAGRSGTVSLYRLLRNSNLVPYHTYWWLNAAQSRWEAMCRFIAGEHDGAEPVFQEWISTRAAEWLGAAACGRAMVGLNHLDTIFAPVFAALHPKSRFVYLRRNADDLFESFWGKQQWMDNQLRPLDYRLPGFRFHKRERDPIRCIAWHIRFTEVFARAMGNVMGTRFMEVQAEDLFGQKRDKIAELLDFIGADIPLERAVGHFGVKINEKAHKKLPIGDEEWARFRLCW